MIQDIFKITDFFDKARWSQSRNYNLINFYQNDLSDDIKILTHWICYITDRQMDFRRIWDVGGFVFSDLLDEMTNTQDISLLNPKNNNAFIFKNNEGKYSFKSKNKVNSNPILLNYDYSSNDYSIFTSRFYPSDGATVKSPQIIN